MTYCGFIDLMLLYWLIMVLCTFDCNFGVISYQCLKQLYISLMNHLNLSIITTLLNLSCVPIFHWNHVICIRITILLLTTAQLRLVLHLLRCKEKLLVKCAAIYQSSGQNVVMLLTGVDGVGGYYTKLWNSYFGDVWRLPCSVSNISL